jgi:hypothetical protein
MRGHHWGLGCILVNQNPRLSGTFTTDVNSDLSEGAHGISIQLSAKQAVYTTKARSATAAVHHRQIDDNHFQNQFSMSDCRASRPAASDTLLH